MNICKKLGIRKDLVVFQEHLNTSLHSANFYKKRGIKNIVITNDITSTEINEISKYNSLMLISYGYLPIFYSRRYLITNYLKYIDIVAVGTISDIVELTSENRIISKYGLEAMKVTKNVGLAALLKLVGSNEIDSILVSFSLAPRINACGRMGNASLAVELFLSEKIHEATKLAEKLDMQNKQRQEIEKKIFEQALKTATEKGLVVKNSIVLYDEKWHSGIIGIVASKLVNMFYKPVILFTKENGVVRGSGRCPVGFSLYNAVSECKDLFSRSFEIAEKLNIQIHMISFSELSLNILVDSSKADEYVNLLHNILIK